MTDAAAHQSPKYMLIFLYLVILTIAEVGVAFVSHLPKTWLIVILLGVAVWKAALVAMYYMHLKFEPPRLVMMVLSALPMAFLLVLVLVTMEGFQ